MNEAICKWRAAMQEQLHAWERYKLAVIAQELAWRAYAGSIDAPACVVDVPASWLRDGFVTLGPGAEPLAEALEPNEKEQ